MFWRWFIGFHRLQVPQNAIDDHHFPYQNVLFESSPHTRHAFLPRAGFTVLIPVQKKRHPPVPNSWVTLPIWTCWFPLAWLDYYRGSFLWKPKLPSSLLSFPLKIHKVITISWALWDKPTSFFAQTQRPFASDCGHGAWICLMPPQPSIQGLPLMTVWVVPKGIPSCSGILNL